MLDDGLIRSLSHQIYIFSIYTPDLQKILGYRQVDITLVETFGHVGLYFGFTNGWFYDKYGTKATCIASAFLLFTSYLFVFLSCFPSLFWKTPVVVMQFVFFMIGQGVHTMFMAGMLTNIKNFSPIFRGRVAGVLGCFIGLSGVV
eukprot:Sdes_comp13703_c0_seq1m3278